MIIYICYIITSATSETCLQGIMVVVFVKTKYSVQDNEYNYHDSLQRLIEGTGHHFVVN